MFKNKFISRALLATIGILFISCSSSTSPLTKDYVDYSLVKGEGVGLILNKEDTKGEYVEVLYPDSSYQEIYFENFKQDFIKKVILSKANGLLNYQFVHDSKHIGELFGSFNGYTFKLYNFGLPNPNGSVECLVTTYNSNVAQTSRLVIDASEKKNFISKLVYADTLFLDSPQVDTLNTKEMPNVSSIKSMLMWLSGSK